MIVTVGGAAPARIAWRMAEKPFIALFGGRTDEFPGNIQGNFWGGVSLNTYRDNSERLDHLTNRDHSGRKHFRDAKICLLVNPTSGIGTKEIAEWQGADAHPRGKIYHAHNRAAIAKALADFGASTNYDAIVISSDPFFQSQKEFLIGQANGLNSKHVCYPFQEYANSTGTGPNAGWHTLHGPNLANEYNKLGRMAATVINANAADQVRDATHVDPVDP